MIMARYFALTGAGPRNAQPGRAVVGALDLPATTDDDAGVPTAVAESAMLVWAMRVVAFDVGTRRTGVALSDASGTLARPWRSIPGADAGAALALVRGLLAEPEGLSAIVVGLPKRLDGSSTHLTSQALAFAGALGAAGVPIILEDERLTSVEAERRLAERERDWRRRKAKLDAASAAIILQDYLDRRPAYASSADQLDEA
jgi:putative Holliday junction resolvase